MRMQNFFVTYALQEFVMKVATNSNNMPQVEVAATIVKHIARKVTSNNCNTDNNTQQQRQQLENGTTNI